MKSALFLFAIVSAVSYARCEDCENCEETRPKTMFGAYKLLEVKNQTTDGPNLSAYEFELMIITHKDNPNEINYSISGINMINGKIYKKDNGYESENITTTMIAGTDADMLNESFLIQIMTSVTDIKYDEKEDTLTIESPKATLIFNKI